MSKTKAIVKGGSGFVKEIWYEELVKEIKEVLSVYSNQESCLLRQRRICPSADSPFGQIRLRRKRAFVYAAPPGFEPGQAAPKADVLPLHNGAMCLNLCVQDLF